MGHAHGLLCHPSWETRETKQLCRMFRQASRNLDFRPPIVLRVIVKFLPALLNRLLFRVHNCKLRSTHTVGLVPAPSPCD